MCGFTGYIDFKNESQNPIDTINRMLDTIAHRGPDDSGNWIDPQAGIVLGHRRLAIVDLSPAGHQPMHSICGRWIIIFNGEIYNHADLKKQLQIDGWDQGWRGHSDTEVILAAISKYGIREAVSKFVGMFAFALWDRAERRLTLVRDRLGEKPLYYGWLGHTFVFASDLQALYSHPQWRGEIDRGALSLLMRHGYIPAPYSIFSNIYKLKPAHICVLNHSNKDLITECYWNIDEKQPELKSFCASPQSATDALENLLRQSIKGQMAADVPVGAFLSGGVDSSCVTAIMSTLSSRPIQTFTIGFNEQQYNEAQHARAVAQHLKTNHTELYVSPQDALDVIPHLPTIYSEPFADSSQIPTYLVSRLARQSVKVCLSGDGGDELFCGYSRYALSKKIWSFISAMPKAVRLKIASSIQSSKPDTLNKIFNCVSPFIPRQYRFGNIQDKLYKFSEIFVLDDQDDVYRHLVSHWKTPESIVRDSIEPLTALTMPQHNIGRNEFIRRMMYLDTVSYLPDDILTKLDRASMGVSLESRVPLLDHRIVEFAQSLPTNYLLRAGSTKWLLRQVLYRYVPRSLIERPKMGFGVPIDSWLRGPLKEWGESLLNKEALDSSGFFHSAIVKNTWEDHQNGQCNNQYKLWNILSFQAWLKNYNSRISVKA